MQEKLPLTAARDCGQSPSTLQRLQEKCQVWTQREGRGCHQLPLGLEASACGRLWGPLDSLLVTGAGFSLGAAVGSHRA